MIIISKKNISVYLDKIKRYYIKTSGSSLQTRQLLNLDNISMSNTSFYRLLNEVSFFNFPEIVEINEKMEKIKEFIKKCNTAEKTITEILDTLNQQFKLENFNQGDVYSLLKRLGLKYKKKDLSKKCYTQSKRINSKYTVELSAIEKIPLFNELSYNELSKRLYDLGFNYNGNPHPISRIRQMIIYLTRKKAPRGNEEIIKFVQDINWKLLNIIDLKDNQNSVKGKILEIECAKGHYKKITLTRFVDYQECKECLKEIKRQEYENKVKDYFQKQGMALKGSGERVSEFYAVCSKGHEFYTLFNNYKKNNTCSVCFKEKIGFSLAEKEIVDFIKQFYFGEIIERDRKLISPHEVDIYLPELNLAIEYHGLYYHSYHPEKVLKDKRCKFKIEKEAIYYHRMKMDKCVNKGVRLISIFEDEWIFKKEICKSKIKSLLGVSLKKYARKLILKELNKKETKEFMLKNHLQGYKGCKLALGLVDEQGIIYCCMTLANPSRKHTSSKATIEISRFASLLGYNITGGFSKILKYAITWSKIKNYTTIKTHCDLRWGTGNVYAKTGFLKTYETKHTPQYVKRLIRYRNQSLRKTKEEKMSNKTEKILRFEQGYSILYDCGHSTWEFNI